MPVKASASTMDGNRLAVHAAPVTTAPSPVRRAGHREDPRAVPAMDTKPTTPDEPARKQFLLPLLPVPETPVGSLQVNEDLCRLVFATPAVPVATEKYFARHKSLEHLDHHHQVGPVRVAANPAGVFNAKVEKILRSASPNSPRQNVLAKLPASPSKTTSPFLVNGPPLIQQLIDPAQSGGGLTRDQPSPTREREEDDEMIKLKQKTKMLPKTDADREHFWEVARLFQKLRLEQQTSGETSLTPMKFNTQSAWDQQPCGDLHDYDVQLRDEKHLEWIAGHYTKMEEAKRRKEIEDEKHDEHIYQTTTAYRTEMRMLREARLRWINAAANLLPSVMLCCFTQRLFQELQYHWRLRWMQTRLRGMIRYWLLKRSQRGANEKAAHILIYWMQKSVALQSFSFRIFRGVRLFLRRVKILQRMWRVRMAKRRVAFLRLQKLWIQQEILQVDAAAEEYERRQRRLQAEQAEAARRKRRSGLHSKKSTSQIGNSEEWLTFVDESIRTQVIHEYLRQKQSEFSAAFRQQEEELFPHLIQALRVEQPNRPRSYIKALATRFALLGKVYETLCLYPGAVDDVAPIKPADIRLAPIKELIRRGKDRSPPDDTGARYGCASAVTLQTQPPRHRSIIMQLDTALPARRDENPEYQKQLALLLQRRAFARHNVTADSKSQHKLPTQLVPSPVRRAVVSTAIVPDSQPSVLQDEKPVPVTEEPTTPISVPLDQPTTESLAPAASPPSCFGLVVASYTFKHLPSLSEKTKEAATQLFDALVEARFGHCVRRGSKLLLNPSAIEFQDAMKEISECPEILRESSFFVCVVSHGAQVVSGSNAGSYLLFAESVLSSEDALLLTAVHEKELAHLLHAVPCKNKLIALDVRHGNGNKERLQNEADSIRARVHDDFASRIHAEMLRLEVGALARTHQRTQLDHPDTPSFALTAQHLQNDPSLFNTVILDACLGSNEVALTNPVDKVSNFLLRVRDACRGGAVHPFLEREQDDAPRMLRAFEVCEFVRTMVCQDAAAVNEVIKHEYQNQVRTKYEQVTEFQDVTQSPVVIGVNHAADFDICRAPAPPERPPSSPNFVSATSTSVTISWVPPVQDSRLDVPVILGYHVEICGAGSVAVTEAKWRRAADFQVLTYDQVVRQQQIPPTHVRVHGLGVDAPYCFRVRARSAGGWGPRSPTSAVFRTASISSSLSLLDTVRVAAMTSDPKALLTTMKTFTEVGAIQRQCLNVLAQRAWRRKVCRNEKIPFLPQSDPEVVELVGRAIQRFERDFILARDAAIFLGRLVAWNSAWRTPIVVTTDPPIIELLQNASERFQDSAFESAQAVRWALWMLTHNPKQQKLTQAAAARRIQGLYRQRKAKEYPRTLALAVYRRAVDPNTGMPYYYNTRTGAASWDVPRFLSQ
ncbi:TPA: LOW QUALITY PROTEIN: hypothetical protein N0F65_001229 [Lagenidium giganteum]|uniref:Fibronectin type-III domain-containing protein n=1 Tax=Lagenidium giganteum TaxID=4803 RepID=A0AAV2Z1B3_9STRA|nr:TPA: LOW QUALITY PROTEIN: hypothetical protein N0F65_001229 [Lagenidium giganteum]